LAQPNSKTLARAVDLFAADFEKSFGPGKLQTGRAIKPYSVIPTGSVALDVALGVGGFVKGRINEIWGPDGIGKTFLCLCAVAQAQATDPDRMVAYIDAENKAADPWADALGVDRTRWMKYVPTSAEDAADAAKKFLSYDLFNMVVVDSIGALISKAELEAQADKSKMAEVARIVTRMMGVMTAFAQERQAVVILVNQLREKIDSSGAVMRFKQYSRTGGWKLKYSTTVGLKVGGSSKQPVYVEIKGTKHIAAREISVKVERNKLWPEGPVVNILLQTVAVEGHRPGIDQAEEVLSLAPKLGLIGREGVKYILPGGQWFRGEQAMRDHLHAHPELVASLRQAMVGLNAPVALAEVEPEDEVEVEAPIGHVPQLMDREVFRQVAAEAPRSLQEPLEASEAPSTPSEASGASWEPPGGWDADATAGWE
jgi:recombination protein RecA